MSQKYHKHSSLNNLEDEVLQKSTLFFDVEEVLLKYSSMFPYMMLVAFEGGGLIRALILLLLYPIICLLRAEMGLKVMVFVCFFGIKVNKFRLGRSGLPKLFLENVGQEGFDMVMSFGNKKVGISRLPSIMVEGYLKDYLGFEDIIGGEIREFHGYYLGLLDNMCGKQDLQGFVVHNMEDHHVIGIGGHNTQFKIWPFMLCKDIYLVSKDDKKWRKLSKDKYPKPLIFHDSRLAFEPTPLATLSMFIWLPFGIILCITRVLLSVLLPYQVSASVLAFLGVSYMSSNHEHLQNPKPRKSNGVIYVCNHKTVIDPVYLSLVLQNNRISAVTYSISKLTAFLSPFDTVSLTRDKAKDSELMVNALSKGDLVVCPEGTTCREPYLLRFSPLFAEMSDDIIPLAIETRVSMFYGTTTTGFKALDPFFVTLNPKPFYYLKILEKLPQNKTCKGGGLSRIEVANYVQAEIGKALGYQCTKLTRKDKYATLAGNDGLVGPSK